MFVTKSAVSLLKCIQCSPYQAVTGKIYRLKQHSLPPATAFKKVY